MKYSIKSLIVLVSSLFLSFSAYAGGHKYTGPDLSGQKVVMFGPWLSPEQETMREVGAIFEKATGATFESFVPKASPDHSAYFPMTIFQ